jgi:regulator of protease activity HflC (stomatin/prohibitin superfamily)
MAEIRRFPFISHLRSDSTSYVIHSRGARVKHSARGIAFWFSPLSDSIAEIPMDDREVQLVLHGRSADFQDVNIQGILMYRPTDPVRLAERVDFTIDLSTGAWTQQPMEKISLLLTHLTQEITNAYVARTPIREILVNGIDQIRSRLQDALSNAPVIQDLGLTVSSVRVSAIKPSADLEKAIEAPTREQIKQAADEAAYARRAAAVEKERAISENEMQNRIELAKREEQLLEQQGQNAKRQAEDAAAAQRIAADAEAQNIRVIEGAKADVELARMELYKDLPSAVLLGLALRDIAGKIGKIEHLNFTPEFLSPLITEFLQGRRSEA